MSLIIAHPIQDRPSPLDKTVQKLPEHAVEFTMLKVPGGKVTIEGKEYDVKPFWMSQTEIVWEVFDIYAWRMDQTEEEKVAGVDAESRPSRPYGAPDRGFGHNGYAAIHMTHHSAQQFCAWLSKKTGKKYRLPTEMEWQLAANAGKATPGEFDADAEAWFWDNAEDETHAVGSKKPNAYGFYDMFGNIAEWCNDVEGKPVTRGGHFLSKKPEVGPTARAYQTPAWNANDPQDPKSKWWLSNAPFVGFRVVMEP